MHTGKRKEVNGWALETGQNMTRGELLSAAWFMTSCNLFTFTQFPCNLHFLHLIMRSWRRGEMETQRSCDTIALQLAIRKTLSIMFRSSILRIYESY